MYKQIFYQSDDYNQVYFIKVMIITKFFYQSDDYNQVFFLIASFLTSIRQFKQYLNFCLLKLQ